MERYVNSYVELTLLSTTLSFSQEVPCSADLQLHALYWPEANKPHGNRLSHANREDGMCEDILVDKVVLVFGLFWVGKVQLIASASFESVETESGKLRGQLIGLIREFVLELKNLSVE